MLSVRFFARSLLLSSAIFHLFIQKGPENGINYLSLEKRVTKNKKLPHLLTPVEELVNSFLNLHLYQWPTPYSWTSSHYQNLFYLYLSLSLSLCAKKPMACHSFMHLRRERERERERERKRERIKRPKIPIHPVAKLMMINKLGSTCTGTATFFEHSSIFSKCYSKFQND